MHFYKMLCQQKYPFKKQMTWILTPASNCNFKISFLITLLINMP